jgi:hypothetical protein
MVRVDAVLGDLVALPNLRQIFANSSGGEMSKLVSPVRELCGFVRSSKKQAIAKSFSA